MDRTSRTLIFRIFNGRTSNVSKVLKKPRHPKSLEKFSLDNLAQTFGISQLDADIFCGPDGNYLHLHINSFDGEALVASILGKKHPFGVWLGNNTKFPKGAGSIICQVENWQVGYTTAHLWQVDDPATFYEDFSSSALNQLDQILPVVGSKAHYHVRGNDVLLHLQLTLSRELPWDETQKLLQTTQENECLTWLGQYATPQSTTPIRKVLRFSL
jgi:hypothetical protein